MVEAKYITRGEVLEDMKFALAQINVVPGAPRKNLETMLSMIKSAKQQKIDLIVFPEMCVGGYLLGDNVWNVDAFSEDLMLYNEVLMKASEGIALAFGNVFLDKDIHKRVGEGHFTNEDGRTRKYNAVYVFQNGRPAKRLKETKILPEGVQPKTLMPNYRFFDDKRYFHSTIQIARDFGVSLEELLQPYVIEVNGEKVPIGFEVCEDLWCEDYRKDRKALNPTKILIENGAKYIVNISASPWTYGKNKARDRRVQFLKKESGKNFVPFLYVNCIGVQNNGKNLITFDGGSTVYNSKAEPIFFSREAYGEELIVVDNRDFSKKGIERKEKSKIEQKYDAIIEGLRGLRDIRGMKEHPRVVVGLSGGIDSALSAALLKDAYGADRVLTVNMPTKFNSEKTKDAARHIAEGLGVAYTIVPVEEISKMNAEILSKSGFAPEKISPLHYGNVMAKIRSINVLSNIAAMNNAIYTSNGNKVEIFFGYATLDGDTRGHVAPLGDLTKMEVVEMSKWYNEKEGKKIFPDELFPDRLWRFGKDKIAPTAELETNQVDPMLFGYHCAMIDYLMDFRRKTAVDVMQKYLEGTLDSELDKYYDGLVDKPKGYTFELMKRYGVDKPENFVKDIEWMSQAFESSVFKRVQSIPIIITSKTAFGFDNREAMLPNWRFRRYEELKEKILKMKRYTSRSGK